MTRVRSTRRCHRRLLLVVLKLMIAATTSALAVVSVGWQPASLAILTGAATWLLCTARNDLAPPG